MNAIKFAVSTFAALLAICFLAPNNTLFAQAYPGGSSEPDIIWSDAFPSASGSAGKVPTGGKGVSDSAWSWNPYGWCFNGPLGWDCETCYEGIPTPYPTSHGIETGCAGCTGYSDSKGTSSWWPTIFGSVATGVPPNSSMVTHGRSLIDSLRFNYIHWGDDYLPGVTGGANLRRYIRTRNTYIPSSLGPDGFLNVDMKARFSSDTIWDESDIPANELFASVYVFDPSLLEEIRLMRVSVNKLLPVQRSKIRDMLLYDAQMQLVQSTTAWWGERNSQN